MSEVASAVRLGLDSITGEISSREDWDVYSQTLDARIRGRTRHAHGGPGLPRMTDSGREECVGSMRLRGRPRHEPFGLESSNHSGSRTYSLAVGKDGSIGR